VEDVCLFSTDAEECFDLSFSQLAWILQLTLNGMYCVEES
jgi:hypothetical protein